METIESIPEARLLLASLRSVGYSEEAAIADLIDNSISAGASEIKIDFDWDKQRIVMSDNGSGMNQEELYENMRIGSSDPDVKREESDLGRFGMGMKTAAFSLGKKLCVISKKEGIISNAAWDLDMIPGIGWKLVVMPESQLEIPKDIINNTNGTAVIIEKLDRIIDSNNLVKAKNHFYKVVDKVKEHIGLVFHRFITEDGLIIKINGNLVKAWDPFVTGNSATQELPDENVWSEDGNTEVLIQPYVLPHKTKFGTEAQYKEAEGPKGWSFHQGVYVYRNRRLIIYGTWFDYVKKEPAYNLARIKVDISSDGDSDWKIDIKKSTAALPIYAKDAIERAIEISTEASAKVYNSRGSYTKSNIPTPNLDYVWEQRKRNGKYSFHINKKHKLLEDVRQKLDDDGKASLNAFIALIENFAPFVQSNLVDTMKTSSQADTSLENDLELEEITNYIKAFEKCGFTPEEIKDTLLEMASYRHLKVKIIELLENWYHD